MSEARRHRPRVAGEIDRHLDKPPSAAHLLLQPRYLATRKLIGTPLQGSNMSGWVNFFPDGKHVLGVFKSGTGIVWNVDPVAWKAKACTVAGRNLTRAEWTEFLGGRNYRNVCP